MTEVICPRHQQFVAISVKLFRNFLKYLCLAVSLLLSYICAVSTKLCLKRFLMACLIATNVDYGCITIIIVDKMVLASMGVVLCSKIEAAVVVVPKGHS